MPAAKAKGPWILRTLVIAGVVLMLGGGWLFQSDFARRNAERVAQLPQSNAAGLRKFTLGTDVLIEGVLVAREPPGPRGFMAFHHDRFTGRETSGPTEGREKWIRLGTVTPRFALESGGVIVEVFNQDYRLDTWPHREQTDPGAKYVSMMEATERFLGFKAGDAVTVEGRVVAGPADEPRARRIEAAVVFGGGAKAYVDSARAGVLVPKIVGGVFAGLGAIMAGVCAWGLRKIKRSRTPAFR